MRVNGFVLRLCVGIETCVKINKQELPECHARLGSIDRHSVVRGSNSAGRSGNRTDSSAGRC